MKRAFAWGGALLFAASLGNFLYTYAVTFRESEEGRAGAAPGASAIEAIAWNGALFSVFALHHSVFARPRVRALVARTVPAELERSVYVWVAAALLIVVCAGWQPVPGIAWRIPPLLGYLSMGAGVWLTLHSARVIDVWDLAGVRQLRRPLTSDEPFEFKTSGPYGYVRHPIYSAWFLLVFSAPVMTGTRLVFAVVSSLYLLIGIVFEERTLRQTTGGAYDAYMRQVPAKVIPGVY